MPSHRVLHSGRTHERIPTIAPVRTKLGTSPQQITGLSASPSSSVLPDCRGLDSVSARRFGSLIPTLVPDDVHLLPDVVNLSTVHLTEAQLSVLNGTVKFHETPRSFPVLQFIASAENAAHTLDQLDSSDGARFRSECAHAIDSATKPEFNLSKNQATILNQLCNNRSIVITKAHKGGKVVVLNSIQYTEMCIMHLENLAYEKIISFGTGKGRVDLNNCDLLNEDFLKPDSADQLVKLQCRRLTAMLSDLVKPGDLEAQERRWLVPPQPYSGSVPKFYGLPKLHKLGIVQLRPLISCFGLYSDRLMIKLKSILNLLLWGLTSLSNSYEFVSLLENYPFEQEDQLLSFDVKSLFTQVPVPDVLKIVEKRLVELRELPNDPLIELTSLTNAGIMRLLTYALSDCYFTWDKTLYKQKSSLPMGGRLSPVLSNLFMEELEYQVLCAAPIIPRAYFRFVDFVFVVWSKK